MNHQRLQERVRADFPFLKLGVAFLDNASTTQKPRRVVEAIVRYYEEYCSNIHRGLYAWSERATEECEQVRALIAQFLGAAAPEEIIFTSGATQSLNMAARMVAQFLSAGDEVVLTVAEHHSNLIPWQLIAKEKKLHLRFLELNDEWTITPEQFKKIITPKTKVLAMAHISNASGIILPVRTLAQLAHEHHITVIVDAAQSVPHLPVNVAALGADMLAFSGHKLYGPTGIGVLYGKRELLEHCEPVVGGGNMIDEVERMSATWAPLPAKFEAGTPPIAGIIGLGAALEYVAEIGGMAMIAAAEEELTQYARRAFADCSGVTLYAPKRPEYHAGIFSFIVDGVHPHDVAGMLDQDGVCVRAGHHCAQPLMKFWNLPATTRASLSFYNTPEDIDRLIAGIRKAQKLFA